MLVMIEIKIEGNSINSQAKSLTKEGKEMGKDYELEENS